MHTVMKLHTSLNGLWNKENLLIVNEYAPARLLILVAINGERAFDKTEVGLNCFMSPCNNERASLMQNIAS